MHIQIVQTIYKTVAKMTLKIKFKKKNLHTLVNNINFN